MDFLKLPPEIMETIFLKLEPQALAACALAEKSLVKVIYSGHFLDAYCRETLGCPWITARDIDGLDIAVPFQFWYLVYTTCKMEESEGKLLPQVSLLTKIGTFKDMFIMWLVCGHRPSYLDSYALMNVLYPLPETVNDVFDAHTQPEPCVMDTLTKVFFAFPEIMHISCGNLRLFQMQKTNSPQKLVLSNVFEQSIKGSLPKEFSLIHSVEIVSAACSAGHPTVILLIGRESWVLWLGLVSTSSEEVSVVSKMFQQSFHHFSTPERIRDRAHLAMKKLHDQVHNDGSHSPSGLLSVPSSLCPIISGENSDIASLVISLAQEENRSLHEKLLSICQLNCQKVVGNLEDFDEDEQKSILKHFACRPNHRNQIDEYVLKILKTDVATVRSCKRNQLSFAIYKSILERLACLFRNETHSFAAHSFSHCFLCTCVGPALPLKTSSSVDMKIEKCVSTNMNDGIFSPLMWPPHVLATSCQLVPVLTHVLQTDINLIIHRRQKCVVPSNLLEDLATKLSLSGLMFTHRPPNKPRCPPLLKQVRLFSVDVMEK